MRKTNSPVFFAARICLSILLVFATYAAIRQGLGAYYSRRGQPDDLQKAMRMDPENPAYPAALASLTHFYSDGANPEVIAGLYGTATRLSPDSAQYWADLASAYEWAGRPKDALAAFNRAIALFPNSTALNWDLANFYVRQGPASKALQPLGKVLGDTSIPRKQVFLLAARALPDQDAVLNEVLPQQPGFIADYLDFQLDSGKIDAAGKTFRRLLELRQTFDLRQTFPYLDALIQRKDSDGVANAWKALGERFPAEIKPRLAEGNLITNGNFQMDILNGGLDWRVTPAEGASVSIDESAAQGQRSLRIDFDGTRNLDYEGILQVVPVRPNRKYAFSGRMRAQGISTDSGPRFEIFDPTDTRKLFIFTDQAIGTTPEVTRHLEFLTGAETRFVIVRVARRPSQRFENKIGGTAWVNDVEMTER